MRELIDGFWFGLGATLGSLLAISAAAGTVVGVGVMAINNGWIPV